MTKNHFHLAGYRLNRRAILGADVCNQQMHHLIPHFIYEQYQAGRTQGHFSAVTLFMDLGGFSAMTQELIQFGDAGAELLAQIINELFEPIINAIYRYGGFVTLFAGDGLTVVFPRCDEAAASAACQTAWTVKQILVTQARRRTPFGEFALNIRQGLSAGLVEWGIVGPEQQKTYFFRGPAISGCAEAENQAESGDIVLDLALQAWLSPETAVLQNSGDSYARLVELTQVELTLAEVGWRGKTAVSPAIAAQFFPTDLWHMPQQGEFRHVVALFIAFRGADKWATLDSFFRQVITLTHQFGGHFVETDFGDKGSFFLLYFGAPVAHENNVKRALDFMLALQMALEGGSIGWRAGIASGRVYAGYVGTAVRDKYSCLGSIVNLAARLMIQAPWGEALTSQEVARHPGFAFAPLGALAYKGFNVPQLTYRLRGATASERVFPHKLLGRETELAQLLVFAQAQFAARRMSVAQIYGEAGIGKSHLTYALSERLGTRVRWLLAQTDPILRQPFNPFAYFLKRYFDQSANASVEENKASFIRRLQELQTALAQIPGAEPEQAELGRTHSFLGALLGLHWPDSLYEQLNAQGRYQNTLAALSVFLRAECARQPVILELEDGHWFDPETQAYLPILTQQTADLPLLILITSRYQDNGRWPVYPIHPTTPLLTLQLHPLPAPALRQLAEDILGARLDARLHALLTAKTQANPFFAQQILYFLQENGLLRITDGPDLPQASLVDHAFDLPPTLNTVLVSRLDRLTPPVKEVVQTAAVLGREFDARLLAHILQRELHAELTLVEQEQIWTSLYEMIYIFKHALLRDAAYKMQLLARLRDLHYRAANAGEELYASNLPVYYGALAHHYETAFLLGQMEGGAKARHYLQAAGQQALGNYEHQGAIDYFSRALALTAEDDWQEQCRYLLARERAYDLQGDREAQSQDLARLSGFSDRLSLTDQALIALRQANYAEGIGAYEMAVERVATAVTVAQREKKSDLMIEGHALWGLALWRLGQHTAAELQYQTGARLARAGGDLRQLANCLHGLGNLALFRGEIIAARAYSFEALTIRREIGDKFGAACSLNNYGVTVWGQGDHAAAWELHQQTLALCQEMGDRRGQGMSYSNLGHVAIHQGAYETAQAYFAQSLAIRQEVGDRYGEAICLNELGAVALVQADLQRAELCYRQAAALRQELNQRHHLVEDWAGLSRLKVAQEDRAAARQYVQQILEYLEKHPHLPGAIDAMRVFHFTWDALVALGRGAEAAQVLTTAVRLMQGYLSQSSEPAQQAMYLNQPHHKALWAAWLEQGGEQQPHNSRSQTVVEHRPQGEANDPPLLPLQPDD